MPQRGAGQVSPFPTLSHPRGDPWDPGMARPSRAQMREPHLEKEAGAKTPRPAQAGVRKLPPCHRPGRGGVGVMGQASGLAWEGPRHPTPTPVTWALEPGRPQGLGGA